MGYKVEFKHPDFGDDVEFDLTGVGLIQNGGSVTLDEEAERTFLSVVGEKPDDYFKDNEMSKLSGTSDLKKAEVEALLPEPEPEPEPEAPTEIIPPTEEGGGT